MEEHLGRDFVKRLILTKDKTLVFGDFLIDDKPEIKGVKLPSWEHLIFDQPYNINIINNKRRINWNNYREVLGL